MNNDTKSQNDIQENPRVPKDILSLVSQQPQQEQSNNDTLEKNINNNKFISGVSNYNQTYVRDTEPFEEEKIKKSVVIPTPNIEKNANQVNIDTLMKNTYNSKVEFEKKTKKANKWFFISSIGSGVFFAFVLLIAIFSNGVSFSFRGREAYYQNKINEDITEFETAVVTDNIYENVVINGSSDAKSLIVKDSTNQKNKCTNKKVSEVETRIESKYNIFAVNLCEIDYEFALEIERVLDKIHKEFPTTIKGHLTNLTLSNMGEYGPIASFVSAKLFAKANTLSTYPNVYKTAISLNAEYFLNLDKFKVEMEQMQGNWFIKNATNKSIVAHEFGHYLSFFAQLHNNKNINDVLLLTKKNYTNYYNLITDSNEGVFSLKIIKEAYNNYVKKNPDSYSDIDEFRASISEYALATDEYGEYIYDETIAEAFHDYYVNKNNATEASKAIVNVLKKYINN